MITELQNYMITELQNYMITELQNYRITELRNYRITELDYDYNSRGRSYNSIYEIIVYERYQTDHELRKPAIVMV